MHIGISLTHSELKTDGISVVEGIPTANSTSEHSGRDDTVLVGILNDALEDLSEQYARSLNNLLWTNGIADPKALAGMAALITDNPATGVVAGIDRATKTWWRNRAYTTAMGTAVGTTPALAAWGGAPITSSATGGGALITLLQNEYRQLSATAAGRTRGFCGSDWLSALETELRANGNYSMQGFACGKDVSVGTISYMGTDFEYDPSLDDLGKNKRCYWFDNRDIYLVKMDGEWRHQHSPARPPDKYVLYRGHHLHRAACCAAAQLGGGHRHRLTRLKTAVVCRQTLQRSSLAGTGSNQHQSRRHLPTGRTTNVKSKNALVRRQSEPLRSGLHHHLV